MNLAKGPRHYKPFQRQPDAMSQHLNEEKLIKQTRIASKNFKVYFFLQ
jgi:hypothetical protein